MGEHITDLMPIHADRFPLNMDTKMKTNNLEMLSNETRFIQYICEYVHIHKRILWFGASFLILTSINLLLLLFCTHAALFLCNKGLLLTFFFFWFCSSNQVSCPVDSKQSESIYTMSRADGEKKLIVQKRKNPPLELI